MSPESFPSLANTWFCWLALFWSLYQAAAGWSFGLFTVAHIPKKDLGSARRHLIYGIHHALWYFACSYAGFASWSLAVGIAAKVSDWSNVGAGLGTLLAALVAVAVLGVSGALARMLFLGQKLPLPAA
ncbi:MAG TPA: hypothetical protein VJB15_07455 [Rhodothermia bacterium]|nr:hypothetical protein [Rhodothermia bacterium]